MKAKISLLTALVVALAAAAVLFAASATALSKKVDPDRDGMPARWEKRYHLNPKVKDGARDYDHDGLTNKQEYLHHTDPRKADTDGDGMPDGWEVRYHLDPLKPDANKDPDHDGASNGAEYKEGTNPDKATSAPGAGEDEEGEEVETPSIKQGYAAGCPVGRADAQRAISTGQDTYTEEEPESGNADWDEGWEEGYEDCYSETLEEAGVEWWEAEE